MAIEGSESRLVATIPGCSGHALNRELNLRKGPLDTSSPVLPQRGVSEVRLPGRSRVGREEMVSLGATHPTSLP
jgi:hypothetical protein